MTSPASRNTAAQLNWIIAASSSGNTLPDNEIRDHLVPGLLDSGGAAGLAATVAALGPLTIGEIRIDQPERIQAHVHGTAAELLLTLHVNPSGLVDDLDLTVPTPPPASREECDARLSARIDEPVQESDGERVAARVDLRDRRLGTFAQVRALTSAALLPDRGLSTLWLSTTLTR
ncbi:hypothetical protein ACIHDR_43685 [Nocardia sp. NPDC052278]|uniref:hypothetical protein n=1 Tax=unclassified Nocardia TaxID=2637762 RepID=UPI0036900F21